MSVLLPNLVRSLSPIRNCSSLIINHNPLSLLLFLIGILCWIFPILFIYYFHSYSFIFLNLNFGILVINCGSLLVLLLTFPVSYFHGSLYIFNGICSHSWICNNYFPLFLFFSRLLSTFYYLHFISHLGFLLFGFIYYLLSLMNLIYYLNLK